jgi:hypothetical protein
MSWVRMSLLLSLSLLLACQVFTQSLAYQAGYHPGLGVPLAQKRLLYRVHGLYAPWRGIVWAWQWGGQAPQVVRTAGLWALGPLVLGIVAAVPRGQAAVQGRPGEPPPMTGHGTTRWARRRDIKKAGLW